MKKGERSLASPLGPPVATPGPVEAVHDRAASHEATRNRVVRSILENGASTAADLADRLDLTPAAVRRHLDPLAAEGLITVRAPRPAARHRGRGRPAKAFVLTDAGRDVFHQAYDELAVSALRFLVGQVGAAAVSVFARSQVAEAERRYAPVVRSARSAERVSALATALTADGYAATARSAPAASGPGSPGGPAAAGGAQLCQHHCPVAHVAEEFPQLCEAETEVFSRLLGTHVQRLATIAHGDGVCTTYVPPPVGARTSSGSPTNPTPEFRRNPE